MGSAASALSASAFASSKLLAASHRVFAQRWLDRPDPAGEDLLGSPDPSSLADAAAVYETAGSMRTVPVSQKNLVTVAVAAALPMVPLVALEVPIRDIATRLIGILA